MTNFKGTIELGGLYLDQEALDLPTKPWSTYVDIEGQGRGDIPVFSDIAPSMKRWSIGETPMDADKRLRFHHFEQDGKQLFICDRNILCGIDWDTLNDAGYVDGRIISIDGKKYLCRLLTGGTDYRRGDVDGGMPEGNEWDRIVVNEDGIAGLPLLTDVDLDTGANYETQQPTEHNKFWNWVGIVSWCQETYVKHASYRAIRGYDSARRWYCHTSSTVCPGYGFRPVLELL